MLWKNVKIKILCTWDFVRAKSGKIETSTPMELSLTGSEIPRVYLRKVKFSFNLMSVKFNYVLVISRKCKYKSSKLKSEKNIRYIKSNVIKILLTLFYFVLRHNGSIW